MAAGRLSLKGLYSSKHDGLLDPRRWSASDRYVRSQDQLDDEVERDDSLMFSPELAELTRVGRQAVGR